MLDARADVLDRVARLLRALIVTEDHRAARNNAERLTAMLADVERMRGEREMVIPGPRPPHPADVYPTVDG